ncbi:MAG TPA: hypothetical protein VK846_08070 [Candidatus Limnocylindria bacterium]|nr:hypothetical protein [Candidatus Limnocylindria bacterium]
MKRQRIIRFINRVVAAGDPSGDKPRPIFGAFAQTFAHRIHFDVTRLLHQLMMVSHPMVEEIALPRDALAARQKFFPVLHELPHSRFARKGKDAMQVIGHEQSEPTMPDEPLVIESEGRKNGTSHVLPTKMVCARRIAIDRDEEERIFTYPLRHSMRQAFADRLIHERKDKEER